MSEHDLEKLLGGFAADTLTPEEKQTLYTAALQDQQLFNALADEQALKELLADPVVHRKLLASLEQKSAQDSSGSPAWLDWLRRPAGLAFAGSLAAAVLAVVLGIRIYQDSLRQAAPSVVTEEKSTPSRTTEPKAKPEESPEPAMAPEKKDKLFDKPAKRERSSPPSPQEQRASDVGKTQAPEGVSSKSAEEVASPADRKLAMHSVRPATTPELKQIQPPATGRIPAAATSAPGARALFYGGEPDRLEMQSMAKEQAMKPLAESAPQADRLERKPEGLLQSGKAAGTATQPKLLGVRYSFVIRETDGREREVDAATASKSAQPVALTIELNQDAYLQVWKTVSSSMPQLLWPEKESGQTSLKIATGQRQFIPLSMESGLAHLTVRVSRVPSEPITREEAVIFDQPSPDQLQEFITASNRTGSREHATYVVKQDPSTTAPIVVNIPLGQ
ncbi:MAG TPA: hypothetical protein VLA67_14875 [Nitrospiraceae bacterium]|nr:hypothetical protein [Nitrospiraceae bacterium]